MNVALSDDQRMVQDSVREMLERTAPVEAVREASDAGALLAPAWCALGAAGIFGMLLPEAEGGSGLALLDAALVSEICGSYALPVPFVDQCLAAAILGSADVANGETHVSLVIQPVGNLAGGKLSSEPARVAFAHEADLFLVALKDRDFAVAETAASIGADRSLNLTMPTPSVRFEDNDALALGLSAERRTAMRTAALVLLAADALGAWSAIFDRTCSFVKDRRQFGQRLSDFQAVRHELADIAAELESARSLMWYAAALQDEGHPDALRIAMLTKAHIAERGLAAARRCVVLHGAIGYAWECDLHLWLKRVMGVSVAAGDNRNIRHEAARLRFGLPIQRRDMCA